MLFCFCLFFRLNEDNNAILFVRSKCVNKQILILCSADIKWCLKRSACFLNSSFSITWCWLLRVNDSKTTLSKCPPDISHLILCKHRTALWRCFCFKVKQEHTSNKQTNKQSHCYNQWKELQNISRQICNTFENYVIVVIGNSVSLLTLSTLPAYVTPGKKQWTCSFRSSGCTSASTSQLTHNLLFSCLKLFFSLCK